MKADLENNTKPIIRKIYHNKTLSVNIPLKLSKVADLKKGDYVFSWVDQNNRLVFQKVKTGLENEE
jgi:hypothetical protein